MHSLAVKSTSLMGAMVTLMTAICSTCKQFRSSRCRNGFTGSKARLLAGVVPLLERRRGFQR